VIADKKMKIKKGTFKLISIILLAIIIGSTSTIIFYEGLKLYDYIKGGLYYINRIEIIREKADEAVRDVNLETSVDPGEVGLINHGGLVGNFSAYTASIDECGKSDGITASGKKVKENETLACPPELEFGTKINIEGMGTYICQDRGGAIKGNHFDIYMETKEQAFKFGRKNLSYTIINN
jgi:3D (Asp-Asp-Asp) domain-containing protein